MTKKYKAFLACFQVSIKHIFCTLLYASNILSLSLSLSLSHKRKKHIHNISLLYCLKALFSSSCGSSRYLASISVERGWAWQCGCVGDKRHVQKGQFFMINHSNAQKRKKKERRYRTSLRRFSRTALRSSDIKSLF